MIRFLFLGTSAGVPIWTRNVTSLAIQPLSSKYWSLIDCGEGTQRQIHHTPCSLAKIEHIFITHMHGDHVWGLPGLLSTRTLLEVGNPLTLIGPRGLKDFVELALKATYARTRYPLEIVEFPFEKGGSFATAKFQVTALPLKHNVPSFAYLWEEKQQKRPFLIDKAKQVGIPPGPYYQKLQQGETITLEDGRNFCGEDFLGAPLPSFKFIVGGDNAAPDLLLPHLENAQLLVHEATYTEEDFCVLGKAQLHSTAKRVATVAAQASLPSLILTHFSPRYKDANVLARLRQEAETYYQGQVELAEDFAEYELTRHTGLRRVGR